jgi:methylmalonyl-CoA/ethylmalonyl-CoA epimerase
MKLAQVAVNVKDLERATAFYRDVLGLTFLFAAPPGLAFFDAGGVRLMLARAERPEDDHPASLLYYQVDDIARAYEEVRARGATFLGPPRVVHRDPAYDLWMASLRDPEGNTLLLMCPKPTGPRSPL